MGRIFFLLNVAVFIVLVPCAAAAAESFDVLLLSRNECCRDTAWPEAEQKIANEFTQEGYRVIDQPESSGAGNKPEQELSDAARQVNAIAAVRVFRNTVAAESGVDIWVSDPKTGRAQYRRLPITDIASNEAADIASLRTLELFHSILVDIQSSPPLISAPAAPPVTSAPEIPDVVFSKFRASLGFAGVFFPGEIPPLGAPVVSLGWRPLRHFRLDAEGMFAFIGEDIEDGPHRATVAVYSVVLKAVAIFTPHDRLHPFFGAFGGASFVRLSGNSDTDAPVSDEQTAAVIFGGTVGLDISLSKYFSVGGFFDGGVQLPETTVVFAGEPSATFGVPVLRTGILLTAGFLAEFDQ